MNSPTDKRDRSDPGDEVLRKFRYQHAYGAILLLGIASQRLNYVAVWCEQHEDCLGETSDGFFDAYQVKTREPELGVWEINDESFAKSVFRFVRLDLAFPGKVRAFKFVSNAKYSNSSAERRAYLSPIKLIDGVKVVPKYQGLSGDVEKGFEALRSAIEVGADELFSVLQRVELVLGPTDRAYEDELAQTHIASLPICERMSASALGQVREFLISRVSKASSLYTEDPSRHWVGLNSARNQDPFLRAKRITAEDVMLIIREVGGGVFRFLPDLASLELGTSAGKLDVLRKKMVRGGLAQHYEMMSRRALTAEQELLDLATRPENGKALCSQIENVVLAECDESNLRVSQQGEPFGKAMLIDVQDRLKRISESEGPRVYGQPYDLLIGVAGLLTSDCKVWWSESFELDGVA